MSRLMSMTRASREENMIIGRVDRNRRVSSGNEENLSYTTTPRRVFRGGSFLENGVISAAPIGVPERIREDDTAPRVASPYRRVTRTPAPTVKVEVKPEPVAEVPVAEKAPEPAAEATALTPKPQTGTPVLAGYLSHYYGNNSNRQVTPPAAPPRVNVPRSKPMSKAEAKKQKFAKSGSRRKEALIERAGRLNYFVKVWVSSRLDFYNRQQFIEAVREAKNFSELVELERLYLELERKSNELNKNS